MSYLPVLNGKSPKRFTNPLVGLVYNNRQYAESCRDQIVTSPSRRIHKHPSNSNAFSSTFTRPIESSSHLPFQSEKGMRMTKILSLSKRLSEYVKPHCSRNREADWQLDNKNAARYAHKAISTDRQICQSTDSSNQHFCFPQIQALILDLYTSISDSNKICKIDLKKYFELYFKQTLSGTIFTELVESLQKFIKLVVSREQQSGQLLQKQPIPIQFANISSKRALLLKVQELERFGKIQDICSIVSFYSLPSREMRQVFLQDLIKLVSIEMYESFNCSLEHEYVLMHPDGVVIRDFAEISFSCTNLFISSRVNATTNYERYLNIIRSSKRLVNKNNFVEALKLDFRQQVAKGCFQQSSSPFRSTAKRINLNKAQEAIDAKQERTASNFHIKELLFNCKTKKTKRKGNNIFFRETKTVTNGSSIEQMMVQQFKILKLKNDYTDTALKNDESARDKIHLGILVKESVYFRNKTQAQIDRILAAFQFISSGSRDNSRLVTLGEYVSLRKVINCIASKQQIVSFISKYLIFDEFGELQKEQLRKLFAFVIGNEKCVAEVILNTVWCWFERNGVIVQGIIRSSDLPLMYERNKLVYYFLISLIFGTNEVSALELAQEILQ